MNDIKPIVIAFALSLIPYLLLSWGYAEFTDGRASSFWLAFGCLLGVRLFFALVETLGGTIAWRLYSKRLAIAKALEVFRSNNFPMRQYKHDDLGNYLARIEASDEMSALQKLSAKNLERALETFERQGILVGSRMHSAWEAAFDIYSPKAVAKEFP